MPKRLTDEEKIARYNERIQLQMKQNKKWVEANKDKYHELMASYSRNYYQRNKEEMNRKRTEYNHRKKAENLLLALNPVKPVVEQVQVSDLQI